MTMAKQNTKHTPRVHLLKAKKEVLAKKLEQLLKTLVEKVYIPKKKNPKLTNTQIVDGKKEVVLDEILLVELLISYLKL